MTPIIVFAGPSLPPAVRPRDSRYDWRAPAAAGDLLALLDRKPGSICLIDGYFDARPAPWHKEILMLIGAGWSVFGAASMGALRAAELDRHGMTGVGAIYRAYKEGRLTADDEVALLHGPEETGWRGLTEPLVEVRATLLRARREGRVDYDAARRLLAAAKSLYFAERSWSAVFNRAGVAPIPLTPVKLKTIDALCCLDRAATAAGPAPDYPPPPMTCFISALAAETGSADVAASRS